LQNDIKCNDHGRGLRQPVDSDRKNKIQLQKMRAHLLCPIFVLFLATIEDCDGSSMLPGTRMISPKGYKLLRESGNSSLYEVIIPSTTYSQGSPLVMTLKGTHEEVGHAYASLLGHEAISSYHLFMNFAFPKPSIQLLFQAFADWLWDRHAVRHLPGTFLEEIKGMRDGSPKDASTSVDVVFRRMNTLANLPADPQNIITMLQFELEKGLPHWEAREP